MWETNRVFFDVLWIPLTGSAVLRRVNRVDNDLVYSSRAVLLEGGVTYLIVYF